MEFRKSSLVVEREQGVVVRSVRRTKTGRFGAGSADACLKLPGTVGGGKKKR